MDHFLGIYFSFGIFFDEILSRNETIFKFSWFSFYKSWLTSPQHVSHFKRSLNLSLVPSKSRINIWRCTHENDLLKQNRFLSFLAFKGIAKLKIIRETIFALFMFFPAFLYKVFHKGVKDKRKCLGWCVRLMPHPTCQPVDEEREEGENERS